MLFLTNVALRTIKPTVVYEDVSTGRKYSTGMGSWLSMFIRDPKFVERRCTSMKSVDGSGSQQVSCDGVYHNDGTMSGGCDKPCRFCMQKAGEGDPPFSRAGRV